ncbi:hypothetical protein HPB50_006685 [Hyalomma asiaticum]|uniref:Uncharacterized protein n=1 Tax=Hyalomma asiaticum TaxID=266040 RepID=A0ACB7S5B4_HYAAI|nr:hypothetical protein HPB50_006685 [Hyalomma asiaticum]
MGLNPMQIEKIFRASTKTCTRKHQCCPNPPQHSSCTQRGTSSDEDDGAAEATEKGWYKFKFRRRCSISRWKNFTAAVVDQSSSTSNCPTECTRNPQVDEQVAIAFALLNSRYDVVSSDRKAAVRAFQKGCISTQAARILNSSTSDGIVPHTIYWFPAHFGSVKAVALNPNESALTAAHALTDCAALDMGDGSSADDAGHNDTPTTHN